MLQSQKIELQQSGWKERLGTIGSLTGEDYTDEIRQEEKTLQTELTNSEQRHRSALLAEDDDAEKRAIETTGQNVDAETRERLELREKAQLTNFVMARSQGKLPSGAESELCAAAGVTGGGIPIELWDVPQPEQRQTEKRAIAAAPNPGGTNLDPVRPFLFSNSIAPKLGIEMPRVQTGTFASATISTPQSAEAKSKSAAAVAVAGGLTVQSAAPRRISARLEMAVEDIAATGQANYESALRQNTSMALSDALDQQLINGSGVAPNLFGIIKRLEDIDNPTNPGSTPDFDDFIESFVNSVDGLWAVDESQVAMLVGPQTYRLAGKAFRDIASSDLGAESFSTYAAKNFGSFSTNARMPDPVSTIQRAIISAKAVR